MSEFDEDDEDDEDDEVNLRKRNDPILFCLVQWTCDRCDGGF
jgi:hypothetical protein